MKKEETEVHNGFLINLSQLDLMLTAHEFNFRTHR